MDQEISAHLLKLRRTYPFLATISLFAKYKFDHSVELFATDGTFTSINPDYFSELQSAEKTGVLLHITLHTALLHALRCGMRNQPVWNIAADIVVNNIILESGDFEVPPCTAVDKKYSTFSVEQVYEALMCLHNKSDVVRRAALEVKSSNVMKGNTPSEGKPPVNSSPTVIQIQTVLEALYPHVKDLKVTTSTQAGIGDEVEYSKNKQYWQGALRKAGAAERLSAQQQGVLPLGLLREVGNIMFPELDWRSMLWNFVVRTPVDFEGIDRRFAHQGLYLDSLDSCRLNVLVAIDTSGSIDDTQLTKFVSELQAITSAYHMINVVLYYVDADIYGPYELAGCGNNSCPRGGGGTDFSVFYENVVNNYADNELDLVVYFTDGYGKFPENIPSVETLWIVTFGGLESEFFPYGVVARLTE